MERRIAIYVALVLFMGGIVMKILGWEVSYYVLALAFLVSIYAYNQIVTRVRKLTNALLKSNGQDVEKSLDQVQNEFLKATHQKQVIANLIRQMGDKDETKMEEGIDPVLAEAIQSLQFNLKEVRGAENKRNWAVQGIAQLGEIRKNEEDFTEYSYQVISHLVRYTEGNQGGIYKLVRENDEEGLELLSTYAYGKRKFMDGRKVVPAGEGLLGQCMLEREVINLRKVPRGYVKITSGLGEGTPTSLVIVPLIYRDNLFGAMEIASFKSFEPYQIEFLIKAGETVASELAAIINHNETKKLLESSQKLTIDLQSREEEMHHSMEALSLAQEEMARKQAELDSLFSSINRSMGAIEFDVHGKVTMINPTMQAILGQGESDLKKLGFDYYSGGITREKKIWAIVKDGKSFTDEYILASEKGNIWLYSTFSPVITSRGELKMVLMLAQDITVKKEKEKEFETLSLVADNTDNSVIITDADTKILYVNKGFTRLTGYSLSECVGKVPGSFLQGPLTDPVTAKRLSNKIRQNDTVYEEILNYTKTGNPYWVSLVINPIRNTEGKVEKYISVQADITETKSKSMDLDYKLQAISRTNALVEFDHQGNITDANDLFVQVMGFEKDMLIGKNYLYLIPEEDREKPQTQLMWSNLFLGQSFTGEFCFVDSNVSLQWLSGTYNPIYDIHGNLERILMLGQFITQERDKKQELSIYANAFRQAFPVFEVTPSLIIRGVSEKLLSILGVGKMHFQNKSVSNLFTDDSVDEIKKIISSQDDVTNYSILVSIRVNNEIQEYPASFVAIRDKQKRVHRVIVILNDKTVLSPK